MGPNSWVGQGLPGTWVSWTPTWANLTVGSGTVDAKYIQFGKTVFFRIIFTYGAGSAVGTAPTFTLPLTSVATPNALFPLASAVLDNNGGSGFNGYFAWASTTTASIKTWDTNNNIGAITATVPFTWAANHKFYGEGFYEVA